MERIRVSKDEVIANRQRWDRVGVVSAGKRMQVKSGDQQVLKLAKEGKGEHERP